MVIQAVQQCFSLYQQQFLCLHSTSIIQTAKTVRWVYSIEFQRIENIKLFRWPKHRQQALQPALCSYTSNASI